MAQAPHHSFLDWSDQREAEPGDTAGTGTYANTPRQPSGPPITAPRRTSGHQSMSDVVLVDPFIPARRPNGAKPLTGAQPTKPPAPVKRVVGNEFVARPLSRPAKPKKPVLDHMRPQYMPAPRKPVIQPSAAITPPVQPRAHQPAAAPASDIHPPMAAKQVPAAATSPAPLAQPIRRDFTPPQKHQRRGVGLLKIVLAIMAGLAFGLLIQSQTAGEIVIGLYAIAALVLKIESRVTFALALAALAAIMALSVLKPGQPLANNFAVYAFLLLAVGTVSLALETRRGY